MPLYGVDGILPLHGLIFNFICDEMQKRTLLSFTSHLLSASQFRSSETPTLLDFLSNPQRSQYHAMDNRTHNSVTECCLSYILNCQPAHFPGVRCWASKSKSRPWLWRWRKPKGVITTSQFNWRQKFTREYQSGTKKHQPFWALLLALKYLPYLLNEATKSVDLTVLAKTWSYRYPLSLFPRDVKKAGKAVEHYLACYDEDK